MAIDQNFNQIYADAKPAVTQFVSRRVLGDPSGTVDKIFLTAWRRRNEMPSDVEEQLTWLYAIARRTITKTLRWHSRQDRFNRSTIAQSSTNMVEDSFETATIVHDCLSKLKKSDREVLILVEWDKCDIQQAAKILGSSEASVAQQLKQAQDSYISIYNAQSAKS